MMAGLPILHVSVGMSTLSASGCPVCIALGKSGWDAVVNLPIRPPTDWLDHVWDDAHVAGQLLSRRDLLQNGLPARAVAQFAAAALRDHVIVARIIGFQRRFLEQVLHLQDEPFDAQWVDCDRHARLLGDQLGLTPFQIASIGGREAALQGEIDVASDDVTAQIALSREIMRQGLAAKAPQNWPKTLELTLAPKGTD
jgi:hypothetical protein